MALSRFFHWESKLDFVVCSMKCVSEHRPVTFVGEYELTPFHATGLFLYSLKKTTVFIFSGGIETYQCMKWRN